MRRRAIRIISFVLILTLALTVGVCAAKKVKSKSVSLNITEVTLSEGDVVAITAKMTPKKTTDKITWTSSDEEVATVNKGVVTGVAEGTAEITATTTSKKTATCIVTVKKFVTKGELIDSIKENTISEADVEALISTNLNSTLSEGYYNKHDTLELIQNTIEDKNYITSDDASSLIEDVLETKNYLTQENGETYAKKTDLDSYAKKGDLDSYITANEAQQLISQNTFTEDEIVALIQQHATSGGNDWEGTVDLQIVEAQELPYTGRIGSSGNKEFTIETITVTKERYNDADESGRFHLYKYTVHVEGSYAQKMSGRCSLNFGLLNSLSSTDEDYGREMNCISEDGRHFTGDYNFYSETDACKFLIYKMYEEDDC